MDIKIAVIDDHQVVINGLMAMLDVEPMKVVFASVNTEALLKFLAHETTDVLFMDIQMPGISGIDLCKQVQKLHPSIKIIAFSSFDDSHLVKQMMRSGAS